MELEHDNLGTILVISTKQLGVSRFPKVLSVKPNLSYTSCG